MTLSSQLLFFFSAIGAFNGLLLTLYLFFSDKADIQRRMLAGLLLVISLRISKSIWYFFDPSIGKQFLQLGLSACFLIGPMLYFYVASVTGQLNKLRVQWSIHLGLLIAVIAVVGTLYPYQSYPALWGDLIYRAINWTWGIYILFAGHLLFTGKTGLFKNTAKLNANELLGANVYVGTALIWLAYFTASYTSYIVGALSFSFVLYLSVLLIVIAYRKKPAQAYADKKIADEVASTLTDKLNNLMTQEQLYKNANLTLPAVAKHLQVTVPQLSQLLNDNMGKPFATFINEWRIQEAKTLLLQQPNATMDNIAEASGYNSQSTFYAAFKQFEQTTPAKYRKQHLNVS